LTNDPLPIHMIGEVAAELLLPDSEGVVLATFSNVAYLRHASDEVIWLVTEDAPMHQRALRCSGSPPKMSAKTPYIVKNKVITLESGGVFDFGHAKKWKTTSPSSETVLPIKDFKACLELCLSFYKNFPTPTGLGIFIPKMFKSTWDQMTIRTPKDMVITASQRFAWPKIDRIVSACFAHDFDEIFEHGEKMIGLGEGLTPSGDDFMGGLFFCIRTLQDLYNPFHPSVFSKLDLFLDKSKSRTNLISYSLLKDHANGHASETLHGFIHALSTGQDLETMNKLGSDLIRIGHSTGWDILTGLLTGMLLVFH
jgi:hypothetical protein